MRSIVTNRVAWCLSVSRSVGLSVTVISPAKIGEPIIIIMQYLYSTLKSCIGYRVAEIPFGLRIRVVPRNHY